ncbi:hypothetical protein BU23DRAFT_562182 [Bimuria novae-zelandiae CBS 107.79]|uniref:Uncharacterized protein n=1 Tax=Bimuria novae-zelandiae CBS 107.79 TaxID=1447943 RepID=A0A6A5UGT8_9PLEO|nr:hypothetical protein BU23DRAFT_562182 [Bimuria novae-zelandiae CBS 107.79]
MSINSVHSNLQPPESSPSTNGHLHSSQATSSLKHSGQSTSSPNPKMKFSTLLTIFSAAAAASGMAIPRSRGSDIDPAKRWFCNIKLGYGYGCNAKITEGEPAQAEPEAEPVQIEPVQVESEAHPNLPKRWFCKINLGYGYGCNAKIVEGESAQAEPEGEPAQIEPAAHV